MEAEKIVASEIQKSSLEKYIEEHHLVYHKYQLEDIQA